LLNYKQTPKNVAAYWDCAAAALRRLYSSLRRSKKPLHGEGERLCTYLAQQHANFLTHPQNNSSLFG
jgi:hypothetical protein